MTHPMDSEDRSAAGDGGWSTHVISEPPILRFFTYQHLPAGPMRDTSALCADMAHAMASTLPPGAELSAGLRKLLEAKDCFVRAALDIPPGPMKEQPW